MNWAWARNCAPDMNWSFSDDDEKALFSSLFSMYTREIDSWKKLSPPEALKHVCIWVEKVFPSLNEKLLKNEENINQRSRNHLKWEN